MFRYKEKKVKEEKKEEPTIEEDEKDYHTQEEKDEFTKTLERLGNQKREGDESSIEDVEEESWAEYRKRNNVPEIEKEYDEFPDPID